MKTYKVTNPGTKSAAVRAYGGLEGVAPQRTRVCKLTDEAAEIAKKAGLKLVAVKGEATLGYVESAAADPKKDEG